MSSPPDFTCRHFRHWHSSSGSFGGGGGAVRGAEERGRGGRDADSLGADYAERPGRGRRTASFSPAKSERRGIGGGDGGEGRRSSSSEIVKVLLRKDSGLRSLSDEAEVTADAVADDVLLSVVRDIDRGSLDRGLPTLPKAPPPPPPLSACLQSDPPEIPPKSEEIRKHLSPAATRDTIHLSAKDENGTGSGVVQVEAAPRLPPRRDPSAEEDAAAVPRVPPKPKKRKENKKAKSRSHVKRPALQPVPEDAPVEPEPPLPPVQRVKER